MAAIAARYPIEESAVEAIWAGCDALLVCKRRGRAGPRARGAREARPRTTRASAIAASRPRRAAASACGGSSRRGRSPTPRPLAEIVGGAAGARAATRSRARRGSAPGAELTRHRGDRGYGSRFAHIVAAPRLVTCDPARASAADPLGVIEDGAIVDRGRSGARRRTARRDPRRRHPRLPIAAEPRRRHARPRRRAHPRAVDGLARRRVRTAARGRGFDTACVG